MIALIDDDATGTAHTLIDDHPGREHLGTDAIA